MSNRTQGNTQHAVQSHRGIFTALVTPFTDQGKIDYKSLDALIAAQLEAGIHGIVPCGTTGESATLSSCEQAELIKYVSQSCAGKAVVCAGTGTNSTEDSVARTEAAAEAGADSALVITPYYNKPSPAGLVAHYNEVAKVGLPVVVYNVPSRTGCHLDGETYTQLAEINGIFACKEASGDLSLAEDVLRDTSLALLSGDDGLSFPLFALGSQGVVSVCSNVAPRSMVGLYNAVQAGDWDLGRRLHFQLLELMRALFWDTNPAPAKSILSHRGLVQNYLRLPMVPTLPSVEERLLEFVSRCDLPLVGKK